MSRIVTFVLLCITVLVRSVLAGGEIPLQFVRYTTDDGLPHNSIRTIAQDHTGFMWFGTEDGLVRFDGNSFVIFRHDPADTCSITSNFVTSLYVGSGDVLWIGTIDGFNRLDLKREKFKTFRNNPSDTGSISNNYILSVYEDSNGIVWIGTSGGGLSRYDPAADTFMRYRRDASDPTGIGHNYISCIIEDDQGTLWLGTTGRGIIRFERDTETFAIYEFQPGVPESFRSNVVRSITPNASGLLWIGTYGGFHLFDPAVGYIRHFTKSDSPGLSLLENSVWSIKEDVHEMIWIATFGGGLHRYDPKTETFNSWRYNHDDAGSISHNSLFTLFFDNAGTLWIGTVAGVSKINNARKQFATYVHNPRDPNTLAGFIVLSMCEDNDGTIWVGADGLNEYNRETNTITRYTADGNSTNRLSHNRVSTIRQDATGILYIGTEGGGLNTFDPQRQIFKHYRQEFINPRKLTHDAIWSSCLDYDGNLWIGTAGGGLNKFDPETETFQRWLADVGNVRALTSNFITSIIQDPDSMFWIGTDGGGLHRFDPGTGLFTRFQFDPARETSVSSNFISVLWRDESGIIWIGTRGGGLNKCTLDDSDVINCITYRIKDGLAGEIIQGILKDDRGDLWISTNSGISKFILSRNTFRNYDRFDGLQGNEFVRGAFYKLKSGELMFGGSNGLNIFHPDNIVDNMYPPPVVITGFRLFNDQVVVGDTSILTQVPWKTDIIKIPYERSMITFSFAALDFRLPRRNQYAYKLEGFNSGWIYCGNEYTATFTNLNPGAYTFRVKASNNDGIWNEEGASVKLVILPPYWKTWWFQTGIIISLVGVFVYVFYSRVEHHKKGKRQHQEFSKRLIESQEKERKRIASELHDGLAQNLMLINYEVMKNINADESESSSLNQALSYIKESVDEVREIAYNLHPHQLERLGLTKALESAAQRIARASGIGVRTDLDNIDNYVRSDDQIHLYRIIQEAFTNIVKHAGAKECHFTIKLVDESVRVTITDDGKGFSYGKYEEDMMKTKGFGLADMEERARLIGGTINIQTAMNRGTIFECIIKKQQS